ncbi:hypothetical protein [Prochlorococcus marinus]|uniref:hypothetical protein n=1 Tax=Prochlorococcus marinus TaxID=1219 RepID=UPI0022B32A10|nr:hypothetical protein [Prochlorococcus marinus]
MQKTMLRPIAFIAFFVVLISSILFVGTVRVEAKGLSGLANSSILENDKNMSEIGLDTLGEEQMLITQDKDENISGTNQESYPDLGDDQVFPFVAGLDSYE